MEIKDEKRGENWAVITIELEVKELLEIGKISISPRWKAAAKQLANRFNINFPVIQIDARENWYSTYNRQYSQIFVFYFGKEKENVEKDESKGKEEADCSPTKQEV